MMPGGIQAPKGPTRLHTRRMKNTQGITPGKSTIDILKQETRLVWAGGGFQVRDPDRLVDKAFGNLEGNCRSQGRLLAASRPITRLVGRGMGWLAGKRAMRAGALGFGLVATQDHMVTAIGPDPGLSKCQNDQAEEQSPEGSQVWHRKLHFCPPIVSSEAGTCFCDCKL